MMFETIDISVRQIYWLDAIQTSIKIDIFVRIIYLYLNSYQIFRFIE